MAPAVPHLTCTKFNRPSSLPRRGRPFPECGILMQECIRTARLSLESSIFWAKERLSMDSFPFRHSLCIFMVTEAPGMCLEEVLKVGRRGLVTCRLLFSQHTSCWLIRRPDDSTAFVLFKESRYTLKNFGVGIFVSLFAFSAFSYHVSFFVIGHPLSVVRTLVVN